MKLVESFENRIENLFDPKTTMCPEILDILRVQRRGHQYQNSLNQSLSNLTSSSPMKTIMAATTTTTSGSQLHSRRHVHQDSTAQSTTATATQSTLELIYNKLTSGGKQSNANSTIAGSKQQQPKQNGSNAALAAAAAQLYRIASVTSGTAATAAQVCQGPNNIMSTNGNTSNISSCHHYNSHHRHHHHSRNNATNSITKLLTSHQNNNAKLEQFDQHQQQVDDGIASPSSSSSEEEEIVMEHYFDNAIKNKISDDQTDSGNSKHQNNKFKNQIQDDDEEDEAYRSEETEEITEEQVVEQKQLRPSVSQSKQTNHQNTSASMESILSSLVSNCFSTSKITSSSSSLSSSNLLLLSCDSTTSPSPSNSTSTSSISSISTTSPWRKVRSLVTSPFIQTYKRQKYPWIQLAGHQGNFLAGQSSGTILKKKSGNEEECFTQLMADCLRDFVPQFHKTVLSEAGEHYLELTDLLAGFTNPSIMDIKMGVRTYLEEELIKAGEKPKLRKDMYEKMVAIDPSEPTSAENAQHAVTKPRYMVWRESISSTSTLGFRIDGVKLRTGTDDCRSIKDFKRTKTEQSVQCSIEQFAESNRDRIDEYLAKLKQIRETLQRSDFFAKHEMIGSSLLLVHDDQHADIWLIDFAKTYPLPEGVSIDHRSEWVLGNHEDGYLAGLDNLIRIFERVADDSQTSTTTTTTTTINETENSLTNNILLPSTTIIEASAAEECKENQVSN